MTAITPYSTQENPQLRGWLQALGDNKVIAWSPKSTSSDFGPLLAPLLEAIGWQGDIFSLTDVLPQKNEQLSLDDLLSVMARLGYRLQTEQTNSATLNNEDLPALFVLNCAHEGKRAWVIWENGPHGFIWEDGSRQHHGELPSANGKLHRFARAEESVDALAAEFTTPRNWMQDTAARFRPIIWHALGLSLTIHLFMLAMPIFSMVVYDRVIATHAIDTLPMLAIGAFGAFVAELTLRMLRTRLVGWLGARLELVVGQAMFERLLFLPSAIVDQAATAAQLARLRAFEAVRDFITGPLFQAMLEVPFITILLIALAFLAGPVALVGVGVVAAYALLLTVFSSRWQRLSREVAHSGAQRQQVMLEVIENRKYLLASGMAPRVMRRFKALNKHSSRLQHRFSMMAAAVQHIAALLTITAGVVIINWCLGRIWAGDMTGGAMVAVMIITWRMLYPLQTLCTVIPHTEQIRAALKQVAQVMALQPEAHAGAYTQAQHPLSGALELQNVSLRYSRNGKAGGDPVFWGLSATIQPGQIVAIYGGNGSGKSSVLRLLMGLYTPALGSIRLDGLDHRQLDPRVLRRQIAYLPQQAEFLPGTIADNLRLVAPAASDDDLNDALRQADAWAAVQSLPHGLDTMLGGEHFMPSTGLAARLCLARLYLDERPIILCDELPVQVLNSIAGDAFRRFLQSCRGTRTVLFVTHREDWMALADQVIWLRPGLLPVVGRPNDLTKQGDSNANRSA